MLNSPGRIGKGLGVSGGIRNAAIAQVVNYLFATYGDSRSDLQGGTNGGPDMYDGTLRDLRTTITNEATAVTSLPMFRPDMIVTTNGGLSGEQSVGWNNVNRTSGRTYAAIIALPWDFILIQYDTNDVQTNVTSTATRDSVATDAIAHNQALITALLADKPAAKVIFQTVMQRSDTTGAVSYGATYASLRRDCCDYINFGNGGAIAGMVAWIQAHAAYGTRLFLHDISALMNIGGVQTGAYLDTAWAPDGCHLSSYGSRRVMKNFTTQFATLFPPRGRLPLYRSTGNNYIATVDANSYKGETLSNCSKSAITYGVDANGNEYGEVTITPNNTAAGSYKFELHADTGTNGGRTPAGPTFAVNDLLQCRIPLTIDDGAGGAPSANNAFLRVYCTYIGGTPALQQITNGQNAQGTMPLVEPDIEAPYITNPLKMTGDSSLIGAPSAGSGLRAYIQIYFGITPTPFRVRWTAPEIRKIV